MTSSIDPAQPVTGVPASKSALRANFAAAKSEIETLQTQVGASGTSEIASSATTPPGLNLYWNHAAIVTHDQLGVIKFDATDSDGNRRTFCQIDAIRENTPTNKARLNLYAQDGFGRLWQIVQVNNDNLILQDADLDLYDAEETPANGTRLDSLWFSSVNDSQQYIRYALLEAVTDNIATGNESGQFRIAIPANGAQETIAFRIDRIGVHVVRGVLGTPAGATGARPAANTVPAGAQFYDTTLGKPIWSNGSAWRDATGATV